MLSITELWCGKRDHSHELRYNKPRAIEDIRPVVVWNCTDRCNLSCLHCYGSSGGEQNPRELTTAEGERLIDDLAAFGIPALLFSGGEPLMRKDISHLLSYAKEKSLPTVISTNGTLIDAERAKMIKDANVRYVGVSLDGIGEVNDTFRGLSGAFKRTEEGFINLNEMDVSSGLRLTLSKHNLKSLSQLFDFVENTGIKRVCFYHLVPVGRGSEIRHLLPSNEEIRGALDQIVTWAEGFSLKGRNIEILTVDNHADNIYLYLKMLERSETEAEKILKLIQMNGAARLSSGTGIACIDSVGDIHPDQFWRDCLLGSIKERPFSKIWTDPSNKMLCDLRDRVKLIKGRCKECRWLELCGGGLRSRAYAMTGDAWAEDPGCYLTKKEISG